MGEIKIMATKLDRLNNIRYISDFEEMKKEFKKLACIEGLELQRCISNAIKKNKELRGDENKKL